METFLQFLKNDILYSPVGTCCPSGGTYLPIILEMFRSRSDMWPWETWITQPDPFFTRPSCLPDPKFSGLVDQLCPHCTLGTPLGWSVGVFLNRCVRYKVCEDTARQGSSDTGSRHDCHLQGLLHSGWVTGGDDAAGLESVHWEPPH